MFMSFNSRIASTYDKQFKLHGARPEASFWFSGFRQQTRFEIITNEIRSLDQDRSISVCDLGCGYGAFAEYLGYKTTPKISNYLGLDISSEVIKFCQSNYDYPWAKFEKANNLKDKMDYIVMSGTFNYAATSDVKKWEAYLYKNLVQCFKNTNRAMIFNLQLSDGSAKIGKKNIYYANSAKIAEFCKAKFGNCKVINNPLLKRDVTFVVGNKS
jgi:SAM-dependent methyltransferase